jgi:purine-nucleoside phosphorylase
MRHWEKELEAGVERWDREGLARPRVAVVAGSGLGVSLGEPTHGPFDLAGWLPFRAHAIEGHALAFEVLDLGAGPVLYYRGRLHAYQGFDAGEVVFPVRLAALLGARTLLLTNAAGGIGRLARPGTLALIGDHVNQTGLNPLRGRLPEAWGPQFPDMVNAYDRALRQRLIGHGRALGLELETGVYVGLLGPSYETPAEVEALRRLGGELVGMSTVLEVLAARQLGVRCAGLSLVTNAAAGTVAEAALDHGDVLEVGRRAAGQVEALLRRALADPAL